MHLQEGTATSIGEQPVKLLVNPQAGARLTVLEALSNLAAAPVSHLKVFGLPGKLVHLSLIVYTEKFFMSCKLINVPVSRG